MNWFQQNKKMLITSAVTAGMTVAFIALLGAVTKKK